MKKLSKVFVLIISISLLSGYSLFGGNNQEVDNTEAISNNEIRTITIVNNTNQIINDIVVYVNEGTEVKECHQDNPDDTSISIKIPKEYDSYKKISIMLVDRFGTKFLKEKVNVSKNGNTEVVYTSDDEVEGSSNFSTELDKWFNSN